MIGKRGGKEKDRPEGERPVRFTYSTADQPLLQRTVIQAIEKIGGQAKLKRLYDRRNEREPGESFFGTALRLLKINVDVDRATLDLCPREGPVVVIANHPYGVLDGICLAWAAMLARPDTKVLTNSVLCHIPEARDNLLPVDFAGTRAARETNVRSRLSALSWLRSGHSIGIFPGGGVSTSERPHKGPAVELPWAPFTAKLIRASGATVIPIFFVGQNSRLFHIASHVSDTLRASLVFRETARRIGTRLTLRVGPPITFAEIAHIEDRGELVKELRRRTFALARPGDIKGARPDHHLRDFTRWVPKEED